MLLGYDLFCLRKGSCILFSRSAIEFFNQLFVHFYIWGSASFQTKWIFHLSFYEQFTVKFSHIEVCKVINDIYDTTIKYQYLVIKFFATNTFDAQVSVGKKLKDYYENIFAKLQKQKVLVEAYLGNGVMIMEQISKTTNIQNLSELSAGNSTMNIFVVGEVVYLIIFKELPFGIKIDSRDFSSVMHFLFEKLQSN